MEKWIFGGELRTGLFTVSTGRGIWVVDLRVSRVEFWVWSGFGAGLVGRGCAQAAELAGRAALAELGFCGDLGLGGLRLESCQVFWNLDVGLSY